MTRPRLTATLTAALLVVPALTWHDLPGLVVWVGGCWAVAAGLVWILRGNKV